MTTPIRRDVTAEVHARQVRIYNRALSEHSHISLLVGDSIMERLQWFAHKTFAPHVVLLAKGGDTTGHLLWRLENTPASDKVSKVILHIGTNNIKKGTRAKEVGKGIEATVQSIKARFPRAEIVLIPLYYRGDVDPELIYWVNEHLSSIAEDADITYLPDFWDGILTPDMYTESQFIDHVHMNLASYDLFYRKLQTLI